MAKLTNEQVIASLKEMTILELNDLVKEIETVFGVTAAAPVAAAAAVEEVKAGPTEVNVVLKSAGANKVAVIKAVQTILGLTLMEAKKIVDGAPATIKEKVSQATADDLKAQLVAAGAEVEIA
jgi:large subunit ribosomal protein L7/L12